MPAVGVATTEFIDAAAAQGAALGFDPAMIFVQHPIQDRTDAELDAMAQEWRDRIVAKIVG